MAKIEIKERFCGAVLFAHEAEGNALRVTLEAAVSARAYLGDADLSGADLRGADLSGAYLRDAYLRDAYLRGADLSGADLRGADLSGADLSGADLSGAYLRGAYLRGAYLRGADLSGAYLGDAYLSGADLRGADLRDADLSGADLRGAYLSGAYLSGADLRDAKLRNDLILRGERPIFVLGPIGSRCAHLTAYLTDEGIYLSTGCFFGTRIEFEAALDCEHGDNAHAKEYRVALAMIGAHEELWAVKDEVKEAA